MNKITVADYLQKFLNCYNITQNFMVTGGAAMHLNESFRKNKKINNCFCHHEQACTMAADGYARISNLPASVCVTAGPGAVNALNGVYGAYVDSLPMIVISGQVRSDNIEIVPGLRQYGDQEINILKMVKNITKFSVSLKANDDFSSIFHKAISLSIDGRPGPVWIDIPIDIQGMLIEDSIKDIKKLSIDYDYNTSTRIEENIDLILENLQQAKRPVVIAGNGVRFSDRYTDFLKIINLLSIPVLPVFNSADLIPTDHKCFCGKPGAEGDRAGNFVQQNSDLLIIIGARMHVRQVGFNWKSFARDAKRIMIDVDPKEMNKPTLRIDFKIQANLKYFLPAMLERLKAYRPSKSHGDYLNWSKARLKKYPVIQDYHYKDTGNGINPYALMDIVFKKLKEDDITVTGDGTAVVVSFKTAIIKKNQRLFHNKGCASMGYDLPAAIGAWFASKADRIICITGDGSLMFNLQELQTIIENKVPIKIIIINNDGYHSIRQSQANYYNGKEIGCGPSSGVSFPNFKKVFDSFGIKSYRINSLKDLVKNIDDGLNCPGPTLIDVLVDKNQLFEPRLASKKLKNGQIVSPPLEDMAPFLNREEFLSNMLIKPWEDE